MMAFVRAANILSRFLVVLYLTNELGLEAVGFYGLITATSAWIVYVAGLELNVITARRTLTRKSALTQRLLSVHLVFIGMTSTLFLLVTLVLILLGSDTEIYTLITLFVFADILHTELTRMLMYMGYLKRAVASLIVRYFLSSASIIMVFEIFDFTKIDTAVYCNVLFSILSVFVCVASTPEFKSRSLRRKDIGWLLLAVNNAKLTIVSGIVHKSLFLQDKVAISYLFPPETLGKYILTASIASAVQTVVESQTSSKYISKLIANKRTNEKFSTIARQYGQQHRKWSSIGFSLGLFFAIIFFKFYQDIMDIETITIILFTFVSFFSICLAGRYSILLMMLGRDVDNLFPKLVGFLALVTGSILCWIFDLTITNFLGLMMFSSTIYLGLARRNFLRTEE